MPSQRDSPDDLAPKLDPSGISLSRSDHDLIEFTETRFDVEPLPEGVLPEESKGSQDQPVGFEPVQQGIYKTSRLN
jgi:hypothetical protein